MMADWGLRPGGAVPGCPCSWCTHTRGASVSARLARFKERLMPGRIDEMFSPKEWRAAGNVPTGAETPNERDQRIAAVLKAFYHAPLTISSVQPILALAVELNPDLMEQRR